MFTYLLATACFLLFVSVFLKNMMIYIAVFASWLGVLLEVANMSRSQDMSASAPIQWVAVIVMGYALMSLVRLWNDRGNGL